MISLCLLYVFLLVVVCLVVTASAVICLERLDNEITYYMSSGTVNLFNTSCSILLLFEGFSAILL